MTTLLGLSGSLRVGSLNSALLRAARDLMPEGATLEIGTIAGIPLYDGDLERQEGLPAAVVSLKDAVASSDGFLLATPEYNNSVPGVLKNAVDWLSRPDSDIKRVFGGKPIALMGASPGRFGTILGQNAWLPVFRTLGAQLWSGDRLLVSQARMVFDENGALVDERTRDRLRAFLEGFSGFAGTSRRRP